MTSLLVQRLQQHRRVAALLRERHPLEGVSSAQMSPVQGSNSSAPATNQHPVQNNYQSTVTPARNGQPSVSSPVQRAAQPNNVPAQRRPNVGSVNDVAVEANQSRPNLLQRTLGNIRNRFRPKPPPATRSQLPVQRTPPAAQNNIVPRVRAEAAQSQQKSTIQRQSAGVPYAQPISVTPPVVNPPQSQATQNIQRQIQPAPNNIQQQSSQIQPVPQAFQPTYSPNL